MTEMGEERGATGVVVQEMRAKDKERSRRQSWDEACVLDLENREKRKGACEVLIL